MEFDYTRFPRVQIWRRGVAFLIDFICVWLLSSLLGDNLPSCLWSRFCSGLVGSAGFVVKRLLDQVRHRVRE